MKTNFILITLAIIATAVSGEEANQVVARFPANIWQDNMNSCTEEAQKAIRLLPSKCMQQMNQDSPPEERLACAIIAGPGTVGTIPFGMYPARTTLDTELTALTTNSMSEVFSPCALAKMINDGCFTFNSNLQQASYSSTSYQSESEYANEISNSYGIDISANAGFGGFGISSGYQSQTSDFNSGSSSQQTSVVSKSWLHDIGILSMDTCKHTLYDYMSSEYKDLWDSFQNTQDVMSVVQSKQFQKLMDTGYYIPTSFAFAVRYNVKVVATYEASSIQADQAMSNAIDAGASASFGGFSGSASTSMQEAMTKSAKSNNLSMHSTAHENKYGVCDFVTAMKDDAVQWSNVFHDCATNTANDLLQLDRAAYIPFNGFLSIFDYMNSKGKINDSLDKALNIYFLECRCANPLGADDTRSFCATADRSLVYYEVEKHACNHTNPWYPVQQQDKWEKAVAIDKVASSESVNFYKTFGKHPTDKWSVKSVDGSHSLVYESADGNLVVKDKDNQITWTSKTPFFANNHGYSSLAFDADSGSFTIYGAMTRKFYATGGNNCDYSTDSPYKLEFTNSGELFMKSSITHKLCANITASVF